MRLSGKVALITGAGRHKGLGEAIARQFAGEGAHVVITDIGKPSGPMLSADNIGTAAEMDSVAEGIRAHAEAAGSAANVVTLTCDVRDEEDIKRAIGETVKQFGKLDIVVNNAGIGYIMKPLTEFSIEEWDLILDVNLRGPFLMTKHAAAQMMRQHQAGGSKGGRIINIASRGAKSATAHLVAYTSSKHGLVGLTRVAAVELGAHGITVNAVCPNHVTTGLGAKQNAHRGKVLGTDLAGVLAFRTSRIPLGRVGLAEDTAHACAFLASDEAAYITGEAMNVSGGEEMH
ncbi:MAG: SDR family oxidoreductase [Rhodospirillaceae bacterium]|nr:SDR family oxidoreductase [Rhodospirillaceae bacterium]